MTVSTTNNRDNYSGNGSTTAFATTFTFLVEGDLTVTLVDSAGTETVQTLTTDYTVSGGSGSTGTVTMVTPPANGETLVIERKMDRDQQTDYTPNDPFPAETHEDALDKLTMLIQELFDTTDRSITLGIASSLSSVTMPDPGAGEIIKYNAAGTDLETAALSTLSTALDTLLSGLANNDMLIYNGSAWANMTQKDFADTFHTNKIHEVQIAYKNPDTDIEVADGLAYLPIPASLNGYNLVGIQGDLVTAGTGAAPTFQVYNVTQAADMLTTKLTLDAGEKTSATAATAAVIDTANDDVATGDQLRIDCDQIGSSVAGAGFMITLKFEKP